MRIAGASGQGASVRTGDEGMRFPYRVQEPSPPSLRWPPDSMGAIIGKAAVAWASVLCLDCSTVAWTRPRLPPRSTARCGFHRGIQHGTDRGMQCGTGILWRAPSHRGGWPGLVVDLAPPTSGVRGRQPNQERRVGRGEERKERKKREVEQERWKKTRRGGRRAQGSGQPTEAGVRDEKHMKRESQRARVRGQRGGRARR